MRTGREGGVRESSTSASNKLVITKIESLLSQTSKDAAGGQGLTMKKTERERQGR